MPDLLWTPSPGRIAAANLTRFTAFVNERHGLSLGSYDALYHWSVTTSPRSGRRPGSSSRSRPPRPTNGVVDDLGRFPGAEWFPGARLNMAENLLRFRDERVAFVFRGETAEPVRMTYAELHRTVARLAAGLRGAGVKPGDRVAGYMPNLIETACAMLAATAVGAVWSSCATDIGPAAAADRLGQIEPVVLFAVDGYRYKGKTFDTLPHTAELLTHLPTVRQVVVSPLRGRRRRPLRPPARRPLRRLPGPGRRGRALLRAAPLRPPGGGDVLLGHHGQAQVPGAERGGMLLNQLKELILHADLTREDTIFYVTTASWMMWNWLISALGTGATVLLYDGNPAYPNAEALWRIIQDEGVTVFGTSASYLNLLRAEGLAPGRDHDLSRLREICQTGSALSPEGFAYVYDAVKRGSALQLALGWHRHQRLLLHRESHAAGVRGGAPSPRPGHEGGVLRRVRPAGAGPGGRAGLRGARPVDAPLLLGRSRTGRRYHEAYFDVYPGVWRHGDYVMIDSRTGGVQFFGRSDAVLKPSGVRIGTAEIYNVVEKLAGDRRLPRHRAGLAGRSAGHPLREARPGLRADRGPAR